MAGSVKVMPVPMQGTAGDTRTKAVDVVMVIALSGAEGDGTPAAVGELEIVGGKGDGCPGSIQQGRSGDCQAAWCPCIMAADHATDPTRSLSPHRRP